MQETDIAVTEDGPVLVGSLDQGQGEFNADQFFAFQHARCEETGLSLASAYVDEAIEGYFGFYGFIQNEFEVPACNGLVICGVSQVAFYGIFQNFLIHDPFEAQSVQFFEKIIFYARAISSSIVENGEIEDIQVRALYPHGVCAPAPKARIFPR